MAIAWISFRSYDEVRHWWDPYRADCRIWGATKSRNPTTGEIESGFDLRELAPANVTLLEMQDLYPREGVIQLMRVKAAKAALWSALAEGSVLASALDPATGVAEDIRPALWLDLEVYNDGGGEEWFGLRRTLKQRGEFRLKHVTVPSKSIVERWTGFLLAKDLPIEIIDPEGPGYMPVSSAALWLLRQRSAAIASLSASEVWRPIYQEILDRITDGELEVNGVRGGARVRIDGIEFTGIDVEYPFSVPPHDPARGDEVYLRSCLYAGEDAARQGFDDSLRDRFGVRYARLMVRKADVLRLKQCPSEIVPRTGAPGRPTSKHLVLAELERRSAAGPLEETLAGEAHLLSSWLRRNHPGMPQLTDRSTENVIRARFRDLKTPRN